MKIETDKEASYFLGALFFLTFFGVCLFIAAWAEQADQPQVIRLELGASKSVLPVPSQGKAGKDWAGL
jgi:hypothetical protein